MMMLKSSLALGCAAALVAAGDVPCPTETAFPWCDTKLPRAERVASLVANLSKAEKSTLFTNGASAVDRIHWPKYNWWSEALHGVARDGLGTSFPQIGLVAASYNRTLWHAIGDVTSTEGRGKNNQLQGGMYQGLTFWAPNVNIFRDREDPTINGEYAEAFVTGMQGDQSSGYLKVSSCLKHYSVYSQEAERQGFPAMVNEQDMEDTYLPAFQAGVEKGNASSMMCSYNAESAGMGIFGNGTQGGAIPSCANKGLMNDLARDKWGFDGYITSDCGAVTGVQNSHHYTNNAKDTVTAVLTAGMDTDCGGFMGPETLLPLLEDANIMKLVDTALTHLFMVQFRLGFADPPSMVPWAKYGEEVVNTPEHQALAKYAADSSIVLLKNDAKTLPLKHKTGMKIAVMGRNANATANMQGNYFGTAPYLISPCKGFESFGSVTCVGTDKDAAVSAVKGQDAIVLVVGLTSEGVRPNDESEGHDRTSLLLPMNQSEYIEAVAAAAAEMKIPVTVVVMGGGPVDISAAKSSPHVGAIMWCGYPGQSGGASIADVVMGKVNPAGKLTLTWYPESFSKQVPITDYGMRPNKKTGNPGRTYRFYTGEPVFKFGEGLSYTQFDSVLKAPAKVSTKYFDDDLTLHSLSKKVATTVSVTSRNTGERAGDNVVLVFASPPGAGENGRPLRSLVAFDRVSLAPGEEKESLLAIDAQHLTLATGLSQRETVPGPWKLWIGADGEDNAVTMTVVA